MLNASLTPIPDLNADGYVPSSVFPPGTDKAIRSAQERYAGMVDCFVRLVRRDGVGALYSGLTANYLKVVPAVGISFVVFEATKERLAGAFPPKK